MIYLESEQVLVPRQVYIGDSAEIHCSFETDSASIRNEIAQKGVIELPKEGFKGELNSREYEIKKITIESGSYNQYTIRVYFNAWHTEHIQIPDFDIGAVVGTEADVYVIHFNPVNIVSIVKTESISIINDMYPPLLLPGTTYKIYGLLFSVIILLIGLIRVIVLRKKISFFFKNRLLIWQYSKNKKNTFRALIKLKQSVKLTDSEVSTSIQLIMRSYLEFRFDYPFTKKVSSEILSGFYEATNNMISDKKIPACEDITQVFIRTDYIRYSKESAFMKGEKDQLIGRLMNAIDILEKPEEVIEDLEKTVEKIQSENKNEDGEEPDA